MPAGEIGNRGQVDRDALVELRLYDSRGSEATRIVDRERGAGSRTAAIGVEGLRSGRYALVELLDGKVVDSRLVSLVR